MLKKLLEETQKEKENKEREEKERLEKEKQLKLDELLSENKRNNILDFLDNIRNYKNPQKLRNLLSIGENVNKNILRDYLRRWKDIHDQEVEYEENVIVKQDILTDLLTKREKKNILPSAFQKWLNKTKRIINQENAIIIQKFCKKLKRKIIIAKEEEEIQKEEERKNTIKEGLDILIKMSKIIS